MADLPQLIMRIDLSVLKPLTLDGRFSVHTHTTGGEQAWEDIIESAFGRRFDFGFLLRAGNYNPKHVFYIQENGEDIATTTAVENPAYPGEGWLRMVGVKKEHAGKGLGKAIVSTALCSLKERGYKTAVLSTDDDRVSALCTYLSVGFRPVYSHESHPTRWQELKKTLPQKFADMF